MFIPKQCGHILENRVSNQTLYFYKTLCIIYALFYGKLIIFPMSYILSNLSWWGNKGLSTRVWVGTLGFFILVSLVRDLRNTVRLTKISLWYMCIYALLVSIFTYIGICWYVFTYQFIERYWDVSFSWRFIIRILLIWLWRLKVQRSALCKLNTQKSDGELWGLRQMRKVPVWGQMSQLNNQERAHLPFLCLFVPFGPSWVGWVPPTFERAICFICLPMQMSLSAANTHGECFTKYLGILWPSLDDM